VEVVLVVVLEVVVRQGSASPAQIVWSSNNTFAHEGVKETNGLFCMISEQTALVPPVRRSWICAKEAWLQTKLTTWSVTAAYTTNSPELVWVVVLLLDVIVVELEVEVDVVVVVLVLVLEVVVECVAVEVVEAVVLVVVDGGKQPRP
jgi:hypothetical protein